MYLRQKVAENISEKCSFAGRERRVRNRTKLGPMGNGTVEGYARGSRVRTELSEFSMESANDKIRARPFRHTKFQYVSARAFALSLFGDANTIFSQTSERTSVRPFPRRSLDHIHHLQRAVFNFHERFPDTGRVRGENTRERSGGKMTVSFIAQKK